MPGAAASPPRRPGPDDGARLAGLALRLASGRASALVVGPARSGKSSLLRALSRLTRAPVLTPLEIRAGPGGLEGALAENLAEAPAGGLVLLDDLDAVGEDGGPRGFERALRELCRWAAGGLGPQGSRPLLRFVATARPQEASGAFGASGAPGGLLRFYLRPDRRRLAEGSLAALRTVADAPAPSLRQLSPAEAVLLLAVYICCLTDAASDDAKLSAQLGGVQHRRKTRRLGDGARRPGWAQFCLLGRAYRWFRALGHTYRSQGARAGGGEAAAFVWEDNPEALLEELLRARYLARDPNYKQGVRCLIGAPEARLLGELVGIDAAQYVD